MTPAEWTQALAQHHAHADATVVAEVQKFFANRPADMPPMRTGDFVDCLWPPQYALGEWATIRLKLVNALLRLGKTRLAAYARRSDVPVGKFYGKPKYPIYWQKPEGSASRCPHCGGALV